MSRDIRATCAAPDESELPYRPLPRGRRFLGAIDRYVGTVNPNGALRKERVTRR
jgi:hypothetical protein